jgi:predicted PurR-regulated permease PerM
MTASLVVIAICIAGAALAQARVILTPLMLAIFLYFLIQPVIEYLFRLKLPPWMLYPFIIALPILFALILVWVIDVNVRAFADRLPEYRVRLFSTLDHLAPYLRIPYVTPGENTSTDKAAETDTATTKDVDEPTDAQDEGEKKKTEIAAVGDKKPPGTVYDWQGYLGEYFDRSREVLLTSALGITMHIVEVTVLVVFYLLFLFLEARKLRGRVQAGFEPETASRIIDVMDKVDDSIRRYLWIKTAISLGLGATTTILGWMFGLDFALLWGVLMFLANYITYVGSIAALVPPIAIAVVQLSPAMAMFLSALLVINRLLWIDYAEIRFSGEHLDVSPLLLLLSIAMLGWVWGVVGMLMAVPLVTSTKIVLLHFDNTNYLAKLMSDD